MHIPRVSLPTGQADRGRHPTISKEPISMVDVMFAGIGYIWVKQ